MNTYFDPFQEIKTQKSLLDKTIFKSFCRMKSWNSLRGPVVFGCFRQKILCVNTFVFLISPKRLIIQRRKGRFGSRLVERQRFQKRVLRITFTANGCKLVSAIHYFRCHHLSKKSESYFVLSTFVFLPQLKKPYIILGENNAHFFLCLAPNLL